MLFNRNLLYLIDVVLSVLPVSTSTHDSFTLSRSLALPIFPRSQDLRNSQRLPSRFLDSSVRDPRGPARLPRIREDFLDIFGEPDVKKGRRGIWR